RSAVDAVQIDGLVREEENVRWRMAQLGRGTVAEPAKRRQLPRGGIKSRQRGVGSGPLHEPGEQPGPRPAARGPSARSAVEAGGPQSRRLARRLPSSATFSSYSRPEASRYSTS